MITTTKPHGTYRSVPRKDGSFKSVCSCGWESEPSHSAGVANGAWNRHQGERPVNLN